MLTKAKLDYFISLADVINLKVDYYTIENSEIAMNAKYVLDKCIELNKNIVLTIYVEKKINIKRLINVLNDGPTEYIKFIHEIEINVGRF